MLFMELPTAFSDLFVGNTSVRSYIKSLVITDFLMQDFESPLCEESFEGLRSVYRLCCDLRLSCQSSIPTWLARMTCHSAAEIADV